MKTKSILVLGIMLFAVSEVKASSVELFTLGWRGDYVRFDANSGAIKSIRLGLPGRPGGIARSSSDDYYFITYGDFGGARGLYWIDPLTGDYEYMCRTSNVYEIFGLAFGPSGTLYANEYLYTGKSYLGTLDIDTGTFSRIGRVSGDVAHLSKMAFSPNGWLYGSDGYGIYIVSTEDATTTRVVSGDVLQFITGICFTHDGSLYVAGFDFGSAYPNYKYCFAHVAPSTGEVISKIALPSLTHAETPVGVVECAPRPAIEVAVDIEPGSCPNPVNVKSKGVLPVAILGTEDVNVIDIVIASIRLADPNVAPIRNSYEDVAAPVFDANDCNCTTDGPDGFLDLTLKFETQRIVEAIGDVNHGDILTLMLTGVLFDETPIEGADCVIIRGRHKPFNKADINKDGVVDTVDFAIFSENWLQSSIVED